MPNNCSAPGCRSNYDPTDRIPVFKMPEKPDELKHAWLRALHIDDIDQGYSKRGPRATRGPQRLKLWPSVFTDIFVKLLHFHALIGFIRE